MGATYKALNDSHIEFIAKQKIFFTATADEESRINLSPKGLDSFRVIDNNLVIFLNKVGSGNESSAHIQASKENPRMTIMFCSFDKDPLILRIYGRAVEIKKSNKNWQTLLDYFEDTIGARQIFALDVDLVQTSCGFGVPLFNYIADRPTLNNWAEKKGEAGLEQYIIDKNSISLDGKKIDIK